MKFSILLIFIMSIGMVHMGMWDFKMKELSRKHKLQYPKRYLPDESRVILVLKHYLDLCS